MQLIHRVIHTVGFTIKADRDATQATLLALGDSLVASLGLKTRVASGPDLSTSTDQGYEWFDGITRDAIWAARLIVGFTDKAEAGTFLTALRAATPKDAKLAYWTDLTGKVGAYNTDIVAVTDAIDHTQIDLK